VGDIVVVISLATRLREQIAVTAHSVNEVAEAGKLLVRNNGRPQLISNTCRHRQAEMMCGSGHAKKIVCPAP